MLATTGIYHRLLTHKSYQAPKFIFGWAVLSHPQQVRWDPVGGKAHHMAHHKYADKTGDLHSPYVPEKGIKGFFWSQFMWLVSPQTLPTKLPMDVERDLVLKVIDRLHFIPLIGLGVISYFIGGTEYLGAFFLSTTLLFHGVQTVNSLAHMAGEQPFISDDFSRNNWFVAVLTLAKVGIISIMPFSHPVAMALRSGKEKLPIFRIQPSASLKCWNSLISPPSLDCSRKRSVGPGESSKVSAFNSDHLGKVAIRNKP